MIARAPVTLAVAVAAVSFSVLLGESRIAAEFWLSWLVHTELTHLLSDVIPWLIVGLWLEPRCGSARWGVWTALAVMMTGALHGVVYPAQGAVFGLSAVVYAVAFAGLVSWRGGVASDPRRWAALLLLSVVLVDEVLHGASAWRAMVAESGRGIRFVAMDRIETTPLLHGAAAVLGAIVGVGAIWASGAEKGRGERKGRGPRPVLDVDRAVGCGPRRHPASVARCRRESQESARQTA